MSESETMNSAILTATIKSLKLLTSIKDVQSQLLDDVNKIKKQQLEDHQKVEELNQTVNALPSSDDIHALNEVLSEIDKQVQTVNQDAIIQSINDTVASKFNESSKIITDSVDELTASAAKSDETILEAITNSDKSTSLETIMKLITGLKNVHNNVVTVANRMETLASNVNGVRGDTVALTDTIRDSNSRIKSMDLRMAAFVEPSDGGDMSDINSALALLETVDESNNASKSKTDSDKSVVDDSQAVDRKKEDKSADESVSEATSDNSDDADVKDAIDYINKLDVGSESGDVPHE